MMGWYGNGWGMGGWVVMIGGMTIFWGLVIFAGVRIFRGVGRRDGSGAHERGASEILSERYARGEIDRQEYETRMAVLPESAPDRV